MDELLDILAQSGFGVSVGDVYCGSPMYADDLALVASSPEELQAMIDIVATFADKWQYQLNADKSSVMVPGESAKTRLSARSSRKWYIGQEEISETAEQRSGPFQRLSSICWSGSIGKSSELSRVSLHVATHHPLTPCLVEFESVIFQRKLNFINSIINLDNNSLPKKLLIKRIQDPMAKGLIPDLQATLNNLNLPNISILLDNPIKPASWKRSIKKQLGVRAYLKFLEECQDCFISECDIKIGRPLPHWSVTVGDVQRTRATNFWIRLLAGCDGLEKDAVRFRSRNNGISPADPSCKLCGDPTEDASHFISCCLALESERVRLISSAPTSVQALLPDHVTSGRSSLTSS